MHASLPAAGQGYCTQPGECLCSEGYTGSLCETGTGILSSAMAFILNSLVTVPYMLISTILAFIIASWHMVVRKVLWSLIIRCGSLPSSTKDHSHN